MRDLLRRFLGQPSQATAKDAKQRLKVLLVHDEIDLPPAKMQQMKQEILEVVSKYVVVESEAAVFELQKEQGGIALVGNLPVRRVHARA